MKERSDSKKNTVKVLKVVLKKPMASQREVAREAGVSNGTAHNKMSNLEHTVAKSDFIQRVLAKDAQIIELGQQIIHDKLSDEKYIKEAKAGEISQVIKENTARYTLFKGNVTDEDGGLKITKETPDDVLDNILFPKKK